MTTNIPIGLCQCGCGERTAFRRWGNRTKGEAPGTYARFRHGHAARVRNPNWRGGRTLDKAGYVLVRMPDHPRAGGNGYVREHILVAEHALGKPLPPGAIVHHVNEDKSDNRPENLVVCPDDAYHLLIHARKRAFEGCGNPDFRRCRFCGQWDDPKNMQARPRTGAHHGSCLWAHQKAKREEARLQS